MGTKNLSVGFCRQLAKRGYLVCSLEYRLIPNVRVYEQFDDVCAGMDCVGRKLVEFPANSENGVITNNTVYDFYRRMLKKLGIKQEKGIIKGTHSFRRNAITDVLNSTNGNLILAAELFGNSPEVIRKNYFTGIDTKQAIDALEQRKWS